MPQIRQPRRGSLQFWPRKRAKRIYPRVNTWVNSLDVKPLGFAGYKVGMTHIIMEDTRPKASTKGQKISVPVTILECPPLKIFAVNFYKKDEIELKLDKTILLSNEKILSKKIKLPKKVDAKKLDSIKPEEYEDIRVVFYTQPGKTGTGKRKPELLETAIGGTNEDKIKFIKENVGKEIPLSEIFEAGEVVDIHSVTKGKGTQGPVKRFGVSIRSRKSEKVKRGPGSLGPWKGQGHIMWRVAYAGQTGYHTRTEYNKKIIKISDKPEEINMKGGFPHYGKLKNSYVLIKGSIGGPQKRIIRFIKGIRAKKNQKYSIGKIYSIEIEPETKKKE